MVVPYLEVFLALLGVYLIYSVWVRLDPRFPIVGALVLLVATALVDAANEVPAANTLAEFVFCLLAAGVLLLLVDHLRTSRSVASGSAGGAGTGHPAGQATNEGDRPSEQLFDHVQEELVPPVDAPGREHDPDEERRDA